MKFFGFEIRRAVTAATTKALAPVDDNRGWTRIFDYSPGSWQQDSPISADGTQSLVTNSAIYSCLTLISSDIAKLKPRAYTQVGQHPRQELAPASPLAALLRRPNHTQTGFQFFESWMLSKLTYGNVYCLKQRDANDTITGLRILDPTRVQPLLNESGDIFYRLSIDPAAGIETEVTVPSFEIIHDKAATLFNRIIGVSPITACAMSGTVGNKISANSAAFFGNMSQPGGLLTAPGAISDTTAAALKSYWDTNFKGAKVGKVAVLADGLAYQTMTTSAVDAELVAQLNWSATDVARAFRIPVFMINAGPVPQGVSNIESLIGLYYSTCLQSHLESLESVLNIGLELAGNISIEFDLLDLLKTDTSARFKAYHDAIGAGWMSPNEARAREGLPPVAGGDTPYLQMQNYSLASLARRDASEDPFASAGQASASRSRGMPTGLIYK